MSRYTSHRGHLILPLGGGFTVPDYMGPEDPPLGPTEARRLIDRREAEGDPGRRAEAVTLDGAVIYVTNTRKGVSLGEALSYLGLDRGDPVRVTLRRPPEEP